MILIIKNIFSTIASNEHHCCRLLRSIFMYFLGIKYAAERSYKVLHTDENMHTEECLLLNFLFQSNSCNGK